MNRHVVHRQSAHVGVGGTSEPFLLLREVSRVLKERLPRELEGVLDDVAPGPTHYRVGRVELDLGVLGADELERELPRRFGEALKRAFKDLPASSVPAGVVGRDRATGERPVEDEVEVLSPAEFDEALLRAFLETGMIPWWAGRLSGAELEARLGAMLERHDGRAPEWLPGHSQANRIARRVLGQFSPAIALKLLQALAPDADAARFLEQLLDGGPAGMTSAAWRSAALEALLPVVLAWGPRGHWPKEATSLLHQVREVVKKTLPHEHSRSSGGRGEPAERPELDKVEVLSPEASDEALVRVFLETGMVPSWAGGLSGAELEARLVSMLERDGGRALEWLQGHAQADRIASRVLRQFSLAAALKLLQALTPEATAARALMELLEGNPAGVPAAQWRSAMVNAVLPMVLSRSPGTSWSTEATELLQRAREAARQAVTLEHRGLGKGADESAQEREESELQRAEGSGLDKVEVLSPEASNEALVRVFLETGMLPSWAGRLSGAELEARLVAMLERDGGRALEWLQGHPQAGRIAHRVLKQLSPAAALKLLQALTPDVTAARALMELLEGNPPGVPTAQWRSAVVNALLPAVLALPPGERWSTEIMELLERAREIVRGAATREHPRLSDVEVLSPEASDEALVRVFLETGMVPSRAGGLSGAELEATLVTMLERDGGRALEWLQGHAQADRIASRVLRQLSAAAAVKLLQALTPEATAARALMELLEGNPTGVSAAQWRSAVVNALLPVVLSRPPGTSWSTEAMELLQRAREAARQTVTLERHGLGEGADESAQEREESELQRAEGSGLDKVEVLSPEASEEALVRVFLETGMVPSWAGRLSGAELEAWLVAMLERGGGRALEWLQGHAQADRIVRRALRQLSPTVALKLLLALGEMGLKQAPPVAGTALAPDGESEAPSRTAPPGAAALSQQARGDAERPSNKGPIVPSPSPEGERLLEHGLPVDNAGLVILHPFLKTFFVAVGLMEGKKFPDLKAQCRAVCLLQWLVHGDGADVEDEHRMALSKLMCGVPLEEVVPRIGGPTEAERIEGEALLRHAVAQWTALKGTSVRGLRETFLQREGLLRTEGTGWVLRIEARPYDMLLERLPWGLSFIRLSWMAGVLRVER